MLAGGNDFTAKPLPWIVFCIGSDCWQRWQPQDKSRNRCAASSTSVKTVSLNLAATLPAVPPEHGTHMMVSDNMSSHI
eukprot:SAG31_NODE_104_length_25069_cov_12.917144_25_plen_78_part_00